MYKYECLNSLYNTNLSYLYNYICYFFCSLNNFDQFIYIDNNSSFYNNSLNNITEVNNSFYNQLIQILSIEHFENFKNVIE